MRLCAVLQIAVSLNYNKVYGWIDFDSISPEYISKNFDAEWKKQAGKFPMDLPNMKKLYEAVDVIGLSGEHMWAWGGGGRDANRPPLVPAGALLVICRAQHRACLTPCPC